MQVFKLILVHKLITLHSVWYVNDQRVQKICLLSWRMLHLDTILVGKHSKHSRLFDLVAEATVSSCTLFICISNNILIENCCL